MPRPLLRRDRRTLSERWGTEPSERGDAMEDFPAWRRAMERGEPNVGEDETNLRHDKPEEWARRTRRARPVKGKTLPEEPEAKDDGLDRLAFPALRERARAMGIDPMEKTRQRLTAEMRGKMK